MKTATTELKLWVQLPPGPFLLGNYGIKVSSLSVIVTTYILSLIIMRSNFFWSLLLILHQEFLLLLVLCRRREGKEGTGVYVCVASSFYLSQLSDRHSEYTILQSSNTIIKIMLLRCQSFYSFLRQSLSVLILLQ